MKKLLNILLFVIVCFSCEPTYTPKPLGFNELELPSHEYELYDDDSKPYVFQKSKASKVVPYITDLITEEDDYVKVVYDDLGGAIWVTYKEIGGNIDTLNSYISNSFRLADGHNVKATGIDSEVLKTKDGQYATSIILEGDVSSQYQFYVHDSTSHFMRFALYFETATKNDSLAPVIEYLKEDMDLTMDSILKKNILFSTERLKQN